MWCTKQTWDERARRSLQKADGQRQDYAYLLKQTGWSINRQEIDAEPYNRRTLCTWRPTSFEGILALCVFRSTKVRKYFRKYESTTLYFRTFVRKYNRTSRKYFRKYCTFVLSYFHTVHVHVVFVYCTNRYLCGRFVSVHVRVQVKGPEGSV